MRDLKYIIKRILIGVGIILVLSFIRGNKVKALEDVQVSWLNSPYSVVSSNTSYQLLAQSGSQRIFRNRDSGDFAFCWTTSSDCDIMNPTDYFEYTNVGLMIKSTSDTYQNIAFFTNNFTLPTIGSGGSAPVNLTSRTFSVKLYKIGSQTLAPSIVSKIGNSGEVPFGLMGYGSYFDYFSNVSWNNYWKNPILFDILPPTASTIESLQPTKITNNNVITGYIFRPKFSIFNTDSYVYQYKVGKDSTRWLSLTSNEQQIKINNNIELYVRIKDKNSNEVVDSQTFTITDISQFDTDQNYNIIFSGEYRTENYLNDNISSKSQSIIQEYQIYVDYTPKTSILKYQYQYVKNGDSLNNDNWQNVASSDNGSFTYVSTENGTLYARILDSSDNNLYSSTFTVNSIGLLAFDFNEKGIDNFLTKLSNKINYGGPVSSLFTVPINLLNSLYTPISNSDSCSNLQLGNLLGTNLSLPCVNVKRYLGDSVYNIIDLIMSFFLILGIIRLSINIYNRFISMKDISS